MTQTILFVDYENVGKLDLAAVPAGVRVPFFYGASQKSVPTDFMLEALKLGQERFIPINIAGQGKNALDFHIAFYLGEYLTQNPKAFCVVLSKDKGFDPLIRHLAGRGFSLRRAATLVEAFPASTSPQPAKSKTVSAAAATPMENALAWLRGMERKSLPRKRKGLVAYLHTHYARKIPQPEIEALIDRLIALGHIAETDGRMTYSLNVTPP